MTWYLSVRKVVPTLTSKSVEIYPSMAGAKQLDDTSFILVLAGAVRPAVVCSGHYIALHRGACRGALQARRERRLVLQVPEVLIEASANIVVRGERRVSMPIVSAVLPCGWGIAPPFIGQGGGNLQACRTILPTCRGMASSAAELTVVLENLAPVGASWRVLCSYRSDFEGSSVEVGRPVAARGPTRGWSQREIVRGTVASVATSCPRALQQRRGCRHSARRDAEVAGMDAQGGWCRRGPLA
jgi:hypothetical protein